MKMFAIKFIYGISIFLLFKNTLISGEGNEGEEFKCYDCSSTNSSCSQNVTNGIDLKICDTRKCFTKLDENGRNSRGCLGENDKCEDDLKCIMCSNATGCNNQKFPENRRECYICEGDDCKTPTATKTLPCEQYDAKGKCYTYFDSTNIIRGCLNQKHDLCKNNPEYCEECESDNCNKATPVLKCFKCDNEKDCKRPDTMPSGQCEIPIKEMEDCEVDKENDMNLCFVESTGNNTVARGCGKTKSKENTGEISYCRGGNCNKNCTEDIQCAVCQEADDPNCGQNTLPESLYKKCENYTTVCHTCLKSDKSIVRGCGKPSGNLNCNFCYTNNCTVPVTRSCYKCDKKDKTCSRFQTGQLRTENCVNNITECITKLDEENYIERRCAKLNETCADDKCKICNGTNCNVDVIPAKRLLCYQCDTKTQENCKNPTNKDSTLTAHPCQIYKENDKCYTTSNETDRIIRACSSDPTTDLNPNECAKNPEKCINCDTDKCNNLPYNKTAKLSCIQCNHSDTNCNLGHDKTTSKLCKPLEFWKNETCFAYVESITNVTRGCTEDVIDKDFNCKDNDKCKKCNTDGCNNKNYLLQTCYKCRSDELAECSYSKLKNVKPSQCRNNIGDPKNKGCFIEKYYNGVIFRGCLVDLDLETQAKCINVTYKDCIYCDGVNCNNGKVPGGSLVHTISFIVLLTSFVFYLIV